MSNLVEFPGLGLKFQVYRAFNLFGIDIYWYGVIIAFAMALGVFFAYRNAEKFGIKKELVIDCALFGIIFAVIGARLYYLIFTYGISMYVFTDFVNFRDGGLAIYGGIIGGALAVICVGIMNKVSLVKLFDFLIPYLVLGQAIGRWGNFFNQEAFGTNTNLPWGMISDATRNYINSNILLDRVAATVPVHPTFLYESIGCLIVFCILILLRNKPHKRGNILAGYMIGYGLIRAIIEGLRLDSLMLDDVRVSQLVSIIIFVVGIIIFAINSKREGAVDCPQIVEKAEVEVEK